MKFLGISGCFHDAAAALVVDGQVVAAAQEERFSRIKHDASIPVLAARACLAQAGITMADLDGVVFYEKPLRKFERILVGGLESFPRSLGQLTRALRTWLSGRLWLRRQLVSSLACDDAQLMFCEHHLSHAASSFLASPFRRAAILTVDGVGEWTTTAIHHGITDEAGTRLTPLAELHFPHSLGLVYSAVTAFLGFEVNEGEFKVMGLASYGTPRFLPELRRICRIHQDGSLEVDLRYVAYQHDVNHGFAPAMQDLLGPARVPGSALHLPPRSTEDQRFADIAASLQALTEEHLLALAHRARELTGEDNLCLAGGVALNCVANHRIAVDGPFAQLFVPPAPGDAGGAVGAALWASHVLHAETRTTARHGAFLGVGDQAAQGAELLAALRVPHQRFMVERDLHEEVAGRLAAGQVGGLCHGRFEWGPRALGNRSIVADARVAGMKDRVNEVVKLREGFRPFAPAVLEEEAERWFDLSPRDALLRPLMLTVANVKGEGRQVLPAITHVDGTARVQCVDREDNPRFHGLLSAFKRLTGVGVLLNTSLNLKDEPICATAVDAWSMFCRSGLDFLVLDDCLVARRPA